MILTQTHFWVHIKSNIHYGYTDYRCVLLSTSNYTNMYVLVFSIIKSVWNTFMLQHQVMQVSTLYCMYFLSLFCQNVLYWYFFLQLFCFVYLLLYSDRRWFRVRVTLPENYPGKKSYIFPYLQLELGFLAQTSDLDIGGFVYVWQFDYGGRRKQDLYGYQ